MSTGIRPGWYPTAPGVERWWTGLGWSQYTRPRQTTTSPRVTAWLIFWPFLLTWFVVKWMFKLMFVRPRYW